MSIDKLRKPTYRIVLIHVLCVIFISVGLTFFDKNNPIFVDAQTSRGGDATRGCDVKPNCPEGGCSTKKDETPKELENPLGGDLNCLIARIAKTLLGIIGTLSFFTFVVSGIRFIVSAGSEKQIQGAKDAMLWALIGLVVSLGSYAILNNVFNILIGV